MVKIHQKDVEIQTGHTSEVLSGGGRFRVKAGALRKRTFCVIIPS